MINRKRLFWTAAILGLFVLTLVFAVSPVEAQRGRRPQRIQSTDPELRLKGYEKHLEMTKSSPFKGEKWYHVGPTNVSGRCTDIAVLTPRGKSYTIYVGTASGGVWKTVNEGTTWEPVFEKEASTSIGDVAIAPSNPDIVWVGTGEANIFRSSQAGVGIYKSTDAGKTWEHMGLADTNTIARIVVHPENPDVVYVAASGHEWTNNEERGVYKTTDGGTTWEKILYIDDMTGAVDLVMDPSNHDTLYATTWQRVRKKWNDPRNEPNYGGSGIHKTTDGGATWKPINNGLPAAQYRGRIGIDLCLTKPNVIYAFVDNYELARELTAEERADDYTAGLRGIIKGATVYRSDDSGESWTQVSGLTEQMKQYMQRHSATYGWVFGQMRVDPNDENTIYTMGLGLNVSNDGGKTFRGLRGMHGDHHVLWIDPDNSDYLVNVNDGGIVISYDAGLTWRQLTDNLPVCQFFNINYDMDTPFRVYGSMQDHGSYRGQVIKGGTDRFGRPLEGIQSVKFEGAPGGEGSSHAIDPTDPRTVYSAGFYGTISRSVLGEDGRWQSKRVLPRPYPDEPRLRGQWVAPFIISPHNPNIIYHGMQYLFMSRDKGDSWERISPDMTRNVQSELGDIPFQTIFSIAESPLKFGLIYVGTDDGNVHVTKDGGKTWKKIMNGLPFEKWVSKMVASAYDMGTVYMTQNGKRDDDFNPYVWKSTDFGETWEDISGNIPLGPVNVIREDPVDRNILYVATDVGVYVTKDGGKKWDVLGGNLPSVYALDLIIHPRDNIVVIATHGRGMWAIDAEPVNQMSTRRRFRRF
jgi:photosystem II stability/assembly factor-like uncharacterized protein